MAEQMPGGSDLRAIVVAALREAQRLGARDVRAEHLLLALAAEPAGPAGRVLADAELDRTALLAALAAERKHSLAALGMPPITDERLAATAPAGRPGWGASAREALIGARRQAHQARHAHQDRRGAPPPTRRRGRGGQARGLPMTECDLLRAILTADLGTVPRALALAGIDRDALRDAVDRAAEEG